MEKMLTNNNNLPLPFLVWLVADEYDHNDDPMHISATAIIKPIRQLILPKRVPNTCQDVSSLIASRLGTAIHNSYEESWNNTENIEHAFKIAGYPQKLIDTVAVNPEEPTDGVDVYLEQRVDKKVGEYTVSGKFDMVLNGSLFDIKTTSVYTYMNQSNNEKYILQGSIYRYLNPDLITGDTVTIMYVFTDWSAAGARGNKAYPPSRLMTQDFQLLSLEATEKYIKKKLADIDKYDKALEKVIPLCTPEELWQKETLFKYYKDPDKTARATKNFKSEAEAYQHRAIKGVGIVVEVKGKAVACNYCDARTVCSQYEQLLAEGMV